jgi:hypothetical protein
MLYSVEMISIDGKEICFSKKICQLFIFVAPVDLEADFVKTFGI